MRILSFLFLFVLLFLGVTFAVLNAQSVSINYYVGADKLPLSLLLVIVLGVGAFLGWLTGILVWMRLKTENMRLNSRVKSLEKELTQLRVSPVNEA